MHVFTTLGTAVALASSSNACCFMQIVARYRQLCSVFPAFPFPYAMHTAALLTTGVHPHLQSQLPGAEQEGVWVHQQPRFLEALPHGGALHLGGVRVDAADGPEPGTTSCWQRHPTPMPSHALIAHSFYPAVT